MNLIQCVLYVKSGLTSNDKFFKKIWYLMNISSKYESAYIQSINICIKQLNSS